jgi:hypothetical protein
MVIEEENYCCLNKFTPIFFIKPRPDSPKTENPKLV